MFREMRRFKQQLPEEECIEILKTQPRGVLAVLGDEGYPYTVPMDFVYDDGKLYFHCAKEGHKLDAVRAYEKVSFCVLDEGRQEENDWWYHFRSVIVFGKMRVLEDRDEILEKVHMLGAKHFPSEEYNQEEIRQSGARVACMELTIEYMTGKKVREK